MNAHIKRIARHALRDESGQTLVMMAVLMIGFLGMAALVADVGDVYYSYSELRSSTDAAALAAAEGLPYNSGSIDQGAINAAAYSGQAGDLNAHGNLNVTSYTYQTACVSSGVGAPVPCISTGNGGTANAVRVTQTARVKTYFAMLFGHPYVTLSASSTALIAGAANKAYNIALVLDTTGSMNDYDSNCGQTQLQCATTGMLSFLQTISPCAASGCGGPNSSNTGVATDTLDRVALFTFPMENQSNLNYAYNCSGNAADELIQTGQNPPYGWQYNVPYVFPQIGATPGTTTYVYTTTTGGGGYGGGGYGGGGYGGGYGGGGQTTTNTVNVTSQVTNGLGDANGFMTNYQSGTGTLNGQSYLVAALGGQSGCGSIQAPYVAGTYYASTIYEAQAALEAAQAANPGTLNAMIIIGDGDMNVGKSYIQQFQSMVVSSTDPNVSGAIPNGTTISTNGLYPTATPSAANGYYPSYYNDCGQAIWAANYAKQHGTKIYTVAYGSSNSGCATDASKSRYGNSDGGGGIPLPGGGTSLNISPCQTMKDMASRASTFYSDANSDNSGCFSPNTPSDLNSIFRSIAYTLTVARLIPNSAWPQT